MKYRVKKILSSISRILTAPFRFLFWLFKKIKDGFKNFFLENPEEMELGDVVQKAFENPGDILSHINDLRKHIFRAVLGLSAATVAAFFYINDILNWLAEPIGGIENIQAIEVTEPIGTVMRVAIMTGFMVALPYIVFELLMFAAPGLSRKSRILGVLSIPLVAIFFLGGLLFAYKVIIPPALDVLLNFMGIPINVRPASYIKFVTGLMFWIGIFFEFPLIAFVLSTMGIIKGEMLSKNWRLAVVIMAVIAAMVTPTVDPVNMIIVLVPLSLLYGLGIIFAYIGQGIKINK